MFITLLLLIVITMVSVTIAAINYFSCEEVQVLLSQSLDREKIYEAQLGARIIATEEA